MALWQMEEVIELINNYRELECLWNYKSDNYKKLDVKRKAWLQLSKESGRDITEIKKKIKHLRTAYVVEKKKVDKKKKSESAYQPHLFYYDHLHFLDPFIVLRRTSSEYSVDNLECSAEIGETAEASLTDSLCLEEPTVQRTRQKKPSPPPSSLRTRTCELSSPSTFSIPKSHKRSAVEKTNNDDKFDSAIDRILNIAKGEEDNVNTAFTKSIAMQLQQLNAVEVAQAMGEIQELVSRKVVQSMQARRSESLSSSVVNSVSDKPSQNTNRGSLSAIESQNQCHCGDVENRNEFEVHTKSWASELQKMSSVQRIHAKREIAEVIYQGQLGSLSAEANRRNHFERGSYLEKESDKYPILEIEKENPEYIIS